MRELFKTGTVHPLKCQLIVAKNWHHWVLLDHWTYFIGSEGTALRGNYFPWKGPELPDWLLKHNFQSTVITTSVSSSGGQLKAIKHSRQWARKDFKSTGLPERVCERGEKCEQMKQSCLEITLETETAEGSSGSSCGRIKLQFYSPACQGTLEAFYNNPSDRGYFGHPAIWEAYIAPCWLLINLFDNSRDAIPGKLSSYHS